MRLVLLLTVLLFASALGLVTSQYRSRAVFEHLEVARQETRALDADAARLRVELGRAGQPASVEGAALRMGLRPLGADRIVLLPPAATPAPQAATAGEP